MVGLDEQAYSWMRELHIERYHLKRYSGEQAKKTSGVDHCSSPHHTCTQVLTHIGTCVYSHEWRHIHFIQTHKDKHTFSKVRFWRKHCWQLSKSCSHGRSTHNVLSKHRKALWRKGQVHPESFSFALLLPLCFPTKARPLYAGHLAHLILTLGHFQWSGLFRIPRLHQNFPIPRPQPWSSCDLLFLQLWHQMSYSPVKAFLHSLPSGCLRD